MGYYIPLERAKAPYTWLLCGPHLRNWMHLLAASGASEEQLVNDFKEAPASIERLDPEMVVLDANILIRAVLGRRVRKSWKLTTRTRFFAPDRAIAEAREHLPEILLKRGINQICN